MIVDLKTVKNKDVHAVGKPEIFERLVNSVKGHLTLVRHPWPLSFSGSRPDLMAPMSDGISQADLPFLWKGDKAGKH
jgi:hypothetical protein